MIGYEDFRQRYVKAATQLAAITDALAEADYDWTGLCPHGLHVAHDGACEGET